MIKKICLVFFLILILVGATIGAEEKKANVFLYMTQAIVIEDKEIVVDGYIPVDGKYKVVLRIEGEGYILKERESLDVGFEITFLGGDGINFSFYIPFFDELDEIGLGHLDPSVDAYILYLYKRGYKIKIEDFDFSTNRAKISIDDEEFSMTKYQHLRLEDLEFWFFEYFIYNLNNIDRPAVYLRYRYLYKDIENNTFPENVFRVPKTKEANCIVVVGRNAAEEDHEIANEIAESLNCDVLYDDQIKESHKMSYNLILVGGPCPPCGKTDPANKITYELVEKGIVKEDYWITGNGSKEGFTYFKNPWGYWRDVIVVAGSDREFTHATGEELIKKIES